MGWGSRRKRSQNMGASWKAYWQKGNPSGIPGPDRSNVKTFMKNRGTNETTESAEKSSVSSKRIAPLPSPLPCVGERDGMRGKSLGWL